MPHDPQLPRPLDDIDHSILLALVDEGRLTNSALAARVGLAESTCAYRVRALRDAGVIQGFTVRVAPAGVGRALQAVVKVRLGSHDARRVAELFDRLCAVPGVQQVLHVAGADDFHLHVAVASAEALRDLVLQHVTIHPVVRQTETQLIFEARPGRASLAPATSSQPPLTPPTTGGRR